MQEPRDILKYPTKTAQGINIKTFEFCQMQAIPMRLLRLPTQFLVAIDVYESIFDFENYRSPLQNWRWVRNLTDGEKAQHSNIITNIENRALNWLGVSNETYDLISLSINLDNLSVSALAEEKGNPKAKKIRDADSSEFEEIKTQHSDLVIDYSTLIWTVAKTTEPKFSYFN